MAIKKCSRTTCSSARTIPSDTLMSNQFAGCCDVAATNRGHTEASDLVRGSIAMAKKAAKKKGKKKAAKKKAK